MRLSVEPVSESVFAEPTESPESAAAREPAHAAEATAGQPKATGDGVAEAGVAEAGVAAPAGVAASADARSAERASVEDRLSAAMSDPAAARRGRARPPSPAPYANGRGVTGRGVVALIAVTTLVGGLADLAVSGHRSFLFAIAFMVTSGVGALVVRRRDLPTAVIAPALIYCVLILIMSLIDRSGLSGSFSTRESYYVGNAFVTGAPSMWIGTTAAALIGYLRIKRTS